MKTHLTNKGLLTGLFVLNDFVKSVPYSSLQTTANWRIIIVVSISVIYSKYSKYILGRLVYSRFNEMAG